MKWFKSFICLYFSASYELIRRPAEKQMEAQKVAYHQFYVWDNVAIALHVEKQVPSVLVVLTLYSHIRFRSISAVSLILQKLFGLWVAWW